MKPPHQYRRIDLAELKAEIFKKLGPEGSKKYFYYLSKFLNLKLSKVEFNKLCLRVVGRENIPLHNQFVHSILKNSCNAKVPPAKEALKPVDNNIEPNQLVLSNGDICKVSDCNSSGTKFENGDLSRNSTQHHQVLTTNLENEGEVSPYCHHANVSKRLQDRSLLRAHKTMPWANTAFCGASSSSFGCLLDSSALRERMEKIASMQGLKGVTMDSASLMNKGLDLYLKGLISSGVNLTGARLDSFTNKYQSNLKLVNGVIPGHHHQHKLGDMPFCPVSLLDFKVAMELNPQQLGEDWPLLMEKVSTHAFGEE